jgi:hypothetical protein
MERRARNWVLALAGLLCLAALVGFVVREPESNAEARAAATESAPIASATEPERSGHLLEPIAPAERATERTIAAVTVPSADPLDAGRVFGRVTDAADGSPISGVRVRYTPSIGRAEDLSTDADGNYAFDGVLLSAGSITCSPEGKAPFSRRFWLDEEEPQLRVDIQLEATRIVTVQLLGSDRARPPDMGIGDSDLRQSLRLAFTTAELRRGDLFPDDSRVDPLNAFPIALDSDREWAKVQLVSGTDVKACALWGALVVDVQDIHIDALTVLLDADLSVVAARLGRVEAIFVDEETGAPIAGVVMHVAPSGLTIRDAKSGADGRARSAGFPPGKANVYTTSDDHLSTTLAVDLQSGRSADLGVIQLKRALRIEGRVELEAGITDRMRIRCYRDRNPPHYHRPVLVQEVTTGSGGTFLFTGLSPGKYLIGPASPMGMPEPGDDYIQVDAQRGSVSGLVVRIFAAKTGR